jgi:hypothetical protein
VALMEGGLGPCTLQLFATPAQDTMAGEPATGGIHGDVAGPHDLVAEGDRAIVRHVGFCSSTRR